MGVPETHARRLMEAAAKETAGGKNDALMAAVQADMTAMSVGGGGAGGRGQRPHRPSPAVLAGMMNMMEEVHEAIKEKQDYSGTLHR